ncbi:cortical protein marker for cell polarity-domain-containing protein [Dichotomocladium elegans]|nr:cortical protein marker for cell polarity-domain-containing protein [Dichotomocladium elegans]
MISRCVCLSLLLLAVQRSSKAVASYVAHPIIDLGQLEQIGIAGTYNGISLYTDTQQLSALPPSTASVVTFSNQTFHRLASTSTSGSIYATCTMPKPNGGYDLYIGGDFVQFGSVNSSNVAVIDLTTGTVSALASGLDDAVYALYCDTSSQSVYAGGRFIAPVANAPQYAESLAYFGGGSAVWVNEAWHGLPWKGLNGPVSAITKNDKTGSIFFGGRFDTTADGQTHHAPASQPVKLNPVAVAGSSTADNSQKAICPDTLDEDPWILPDETRGQWTATFAYSVTPSLFRLANTHLDGRGTQNFSILSLPSQDHFNLSYIDPVTKKRTTCSTNCSLSSDPSIKYQDFLVIGSSLLSAGITIDVQSWYGQGGGLNAVEVFQSEIFVYAVNSLNGAACATSMAYTQRSQVTTIGTWTSGQMTDSYIYTLSTTIRSDQIRSSTAAARFIPYLVEAGSYDVYLYAPPCTEGTCDSRTQVEVSTYTTATQHTTKTVDLNNRTNNTFLVYSGMLPATTASFQPYVSVKVAASAKGPTNGAVTIALQAVQFIKLASNTALMSIVEFTPKDDAAQQNSVVAGEYAALADNIPYRSTVNALLSYDASVYIGGSFVAAGANASFQNIVRYDSSSRKMVPLNSAGLNGQVSSIVQMGADLYVGGTFTAPAAGDTLVLNNVARYNMGRDSWSALAGGVNGPVEAVSLSGDRTCVIVSGSHTGSYRDPNIKAANGTSGNAWWNMTSNSWTFDTQYISGAIYNVFQTTNNSADITVYTGNLKAAQTYQSRGMSSMSDNSDSIAPFPVYLDASQTHKITAGTFWSYNSESNATATILAGQFALESGIENVAVSVNGSWNGIGARWTGDVKTMTVEGGYLYMGGSFNASSGNDASSIIIYDLVNKTFVPVPQLHTSDKSPAQVNLIRRHPQDNVMVVAGKFSTAGSLSCRNVCILDITTHQWNNLGDSGLSGEVLDFALTDSKLVVAGNLGMFGTISPLVQYDYSSSRWSPIVPSDSTDSLPGNTTAVSYDGLTQKIFIAGQTATGAYIRVWDGQIFSSPDKDLGPGSIIRQISVLPLKESGKADLFGNDKGVLVASGLLNLGAYGNLSSAIYNGSQWIPYLTVASEDGSVDSLSRMFFKSYDINLYGTAYLPMPIVVLVSIAGALGIVFAIVLCTLCLLFIKRKRESKVNPTNSPNSYYGKNPRRPESLLALINASNASDTAFNPKKGLSEDSPVSDDQSFHAIGREVKPEMIESHTDRANIATVTGITAVAAAATAGAETKHSYSREPQSPTAARSAAAGSTAISERPTVSNDAPSAGPLAFSNVSYNPYNPFRSSSVGVAISNNQADSEINSNAASADGAYASRTLMKNVPQASFLNSAPMPQATSNVRWTNAPAAEMSTAAIVGATSMLPPASGLQTDDSPSTVRWTNVPGGDSAAMAVVKPVSMMSTTSPLAVESHAEDKPSAVRWTNVPSMDEPSTARVGPVSMYSTNSMLIPSDNQSMSNVRWTNANFGDVAMGTAVVAPIIAADRDSVIDRDGRDLNRPTMSSSVNTTAMSATATTTAAAVSGHGKSDTGKIGEQEPSNVRWTNYTTREAQGVASLRPVTAISMYSDVSTAFGPETDLFRGAARPSLIDFSSDPDIVRWTTTPEAAAAKGTGIVISSAEDSNNNNGSSRSSRSSDVKQSNNHQRMSSETKMFARQYESGLDLASLTWAEVPEQNKTEEHSSGLTSGRQARDMDASKDIVSDRPAVAGVPSAASAAASGPEHNESSDGDSDSGNDDIASSVFRTGSFRWSETPSLPAIDTNFVFDPTSGQRMSPALNSPEDPSVRWKEAQVASPIERGHAPQIVGASAATVTVAQAYHNKVEDGDSDSEDDSVKDQGLSGKAAQMINVGDGRAASKRMVQDYLSTREHALVAAAEQPVKKTFHKDFRIAMEAAARNNNDDLPTTEDHPHLYTAKFDFNAREHGELGFDKGDPIIVVDRSDDIWWMGYKDNGEQGPMQGVFPSNYVERAPAA